MFNILQSFIQKIIIAITSTTITVTSIFTPPTPTLTPIPIPTITLTNIVTPYPIPTPYISANGTYSDWNKSVSIELRLPVNDGNIEGNVSGVCNGEIKGKYIYGEIGNISGTAEGSCSGELIKKPDKEYIARATFKGKVYLSENLVKIDFDGNLYPNKPYTDNILHIPYKNKNVVLSIKR